jgi:hypothetical protein
MINELNLKSYDYLMNSTLLRIESGKNFDERFKPYPEKFIKKIILYFESKEEFEKCQTLQNFINIRFNHDLNFKLDKMYNLKKEIPTKLRTEIELFISNSLNGKETKDKFVEFINKSFDEGVKFNTTERSTERWDNCGPL